MPGALPALATPDPPRRDSETPISPSITSTRTLGYSSDDDNAAVDANDDGDLSDSAIAHLLREAELRIKASASAKKAQKVSLQATFPKLDVGTTLPPPVIVTQGAVSRVAISMQKSREPVADEPAVRPVVKPSSKKNVSTAAPTAGPQWFDMPRTDLSDLAVKRDLQLLKARNVLDPHLHYKKDKSGLPTYSQMGTVIEGPTEVYSARINKKDRKCTMLEEILADGSNRKRFKNKYNEIQKSKQSGKKEFYKKLKEQRKAKMRN